MIIDITQGLSPGMAGFPGDAEYAEGWTFRLGPDCPVNVSRVSFSVHCGTHADAPLHYDPTGVAVGALDLLPYLGPCRVIQAIAPGRLIEWHHLAHALSDLPPRLLVRTYQRMPIDQWDPNLSAYAPETLERLADLGVLLVGIDTASIDPANSKTLPSHQVIRQRGLRVLENLVLDAVPEGDYELIALPLKLMLADASPVRAILRDLP